MKIGDIVKKVGGNQQMRIVSEDQGKFVCSWIQNNPTVDSFPAAELELVREGRPPTASPKKCNCGG